MNDSKQQQIPKWLFILPSVAIILIIIGFFVDPDRQAMNVWKIAGFVLAGINIVIFAVVLRKGKKG